MPSEESKLAHLRSLIRVFDDRLKKSRIRNYNKVADLIFVATFAMSFSIAFSISMNIDNMCINPVD